MSLIKLAEQENLPEVQLMDKETIAWIAKNNPGFDQPRLNSDLLEKVINDIIRFTPKRSWFLSRQGVDTIHGLRHILRAIANLSYIANTGEVPFVILRNALVAASLHDLRRQNDKGDAGHSQKAANWFREHINKVQQNFRVKLKSEDIEQISITILLHEIPYTDINSDSRYINNKQTVDLLKTSDALDRYRLPKLKWWINDEYLKLLPDEENKSFAFYLVIGSERKYLEGVKNEESVIFTLKGLGKF